MITEHDKAAAGHVQEQINYDHGILEIIRLLVDHLTERGFVDRECVRRTLEARVAVWMAPTPDRPAGRNSARAEPLQILAALLSPAVAAPDERAN